MNTTQLECFMAVANFLNFSRAAEHLKLTQPAVSHQINALEAELGAKLFHRTSKVVRLTQEGYLFTQYAGEMLKLAELSRIRMQEFWKTVPAHLAIGCRNTLELRLLRPALEELRRSGERSLPLLRFIPFDSLENLLADGDIQVMFAFRGSAPPKARYRELTHCRVVCLCSPDHPLAREDRLTVEQLQAGGRIAVCRPPICPQELFAIQSQIVGGRGPGQVLFCDNQEVVCTLVESGYAFTVTADFPQARLPGLCAIPIMEFEPISFGAVYLPGERSSALKQLLDLLEQVLNSAVPANDMDVG